MPSGKTHLGVNSALALPTLGLVAYQMGWDWSLPFAGGYLFAMAFCTPDLDQDRPTRSQWNALTAFGFLGRLYTWFWWPYGQLFRHRGVSHLLLLGTFTRFAYLSAPWFLLYLGVLGRAMPWDTAGAVFLGFAVSDAYHIVLDTLAGYARAFFYK